MAAAAGPFGTNQFRRVAGIAVFDEVQPREIGSVEGFGLAEGMIGLDRPFLDRAPLKRLEQQEVAGHMLMDHVERQKRVTQVIGKRP